MDYVTRLEQGRAANPSEQVVSALVRALRLSGVDREQLFHAAGLIAPGQGTVPCHVTPSVQRLLDRLTHLPVAVFDAAYTQLLANPMYTALMGEFDGDERNAVYRNFLGAGSRVRHTPQTLLALRTVHAAGLRAAARRYPADPYVARLVTELRSRRTLFADLWVGGDSVPPTGSRKTADHPAVGPLTLDCDELTVAAPTCASWSTAANPVPRTPSASS